MDYGVGRMAGGRNAWSRRSQGNRGNNCTARAQFVASKLPSCSGGFSGLVSPNRHHRLQPGHRWVLGRLMLGSGRLVAARSSNLREVRQCSIARPVGTDAKTRAPVWGYAAVASIAVSGNTVAGTAGQFTASGAVIGGIVTDADVPGTAVSGRTISGKKITEAFIPGVVVRSNAANDNVSGVEVDNDSISGSDWGSAGGSPKPPGIIVAATPLRRFRPLSRPCWPEMSFWATPSARSSAASGRRPPRIPMRERTPSPSSPKVPPSQCSGAGQRTLDGGKGWLKLLLWEFRALRLDGRHDAERPSCGRRPGRRHRYGQADSGAALRGRQSSIGADRPASRRAMGNHHLGLLYSPRLGT